MRIFTLAILYFCVIETALSQDDNEPVLTTPTRFTFKLGGVDVNRGAINQVLTDNNYAPIGPISTREINFIQKRTKSRFGSTMGLTYLFAGNNDFYTNTPGTNFRQNRTFKGYGLNLSSEYYVLNKERFKLYTPLSIQFTRMKFATFESIPPIFHLSYTHDIIEKKYTIWKQSFELGINAEYGIPTGIFIWIIGFNFGYRLDFDDNPWKYSDEISIGFPSLKNQGFVWGVSFGVSRRAELNNTPKKM